MIDHRQADHFPKPSAAGTAILRAHPIRRRLAKRKTVLRGTFPGQDRRPSAFPSHARPIFQQATWFFAGPSPAFHTQPNAIGCAGPLAPPPGPRD